MFAKKLFSTAPKDCCNEKTLSRMARQHALTPAKSAQMNGFRRRALACIRWTGRAIETPRKVYQDGLLPGTGFDSDVSPPRFFHRLFRRRMASRPAVVRGLPDRVVRFVAFRCSPGRRRRRGRWKMTHQLAAGDMGRRRPQPWPRIFLRFSSQSKKNLLTPHSRFTKLESRWSCFPLWQIP